MVNSSITIHNPRTLTSTQMIKRMNSVSGKIANNQTIILNGIAR